MDKIFETLTKDGQNTVDGVVKWMKDEKIIDGIKVTEEVARKQFGELTGKIDLTQFKDVMAKVAGLTSINVDKLIDTVAKTGKDQLDEAFKKLEKEGKNSVDGVVKWLQESKLIDDKKETEDKARKLFEEVKDGEKVELEKFKQGLEKLAGEQHKTLGDFTKTLMQEAPKWFNALGAATSAFKDALNKK